MPVSSFFSGLQRLAGQKLNEVQRRYGQVDKNVFGGLLPGGAATPIGASFQRSGIPKSEQPSDFNRRKAAVIDAAAGAVARAQPFFERVVTGTPEPVQSAISAGFNAAPVSANLFLRYYTGLGEKGLKLPDSLLQNVSNVVNYPSYAADSLQVNQKQEKELKQIMSDPKAAGMENPNIRRHINDVFAEVKSNISRIRSGDVPYDGYSNSGNAGPLSSSSTSLGRVWFRPEKDSYAANEKYDFVYGAADSKQQARPGISALTPSQDASLTAAVGIKTPKGAVVDASAQPITFFGRSVVMKMPDKSFEYDIKIPRNKPQ